MKLLKALTILLFSLFLSFSVVYAQENNSAGTGVTNQPQDNSSGAVTGSETVKAVEEKAEKEAAKTDLSGIKKTAVKENISESRKTGSKKNPEKKEVQSSAGVKEGNSGKIKMEGDLLMINEGNFKYKRIPDIKLNDIKPQTAELNKQPAELSKSGQEKSTGFLGLSKTASDIIVKGGVLILILLIFVLYKSRMSHPGKKSSKRRNVLNSYRK